MGSSGSSAGSLVRSSQSGIVIQLGVVSALRDVDASPGEVMPLAVTAPAFWKKLLRVILLILKFFILNKKGFKRTAGSGLHFAGESIRPCCVEHKDPLP